MHSEAPPLEGGLSGEPAVAYAIRAKRTSIEPGDARWRVRILGVEEHVQPFVLIDDAGNSVRVVLSDGAMRKLRRVRAVETVRSGRASERGAPLFARLASAGGAFDEVLLEESALVAGDRVVLRGAMADRELQQTGYREAVRAQVFEAVTVEEA